MLLDSPHIWHRNIVIQDAGKMCVFYAMTTRVYAKKINHTVHNFIAWPYSQYTVEQGTQRL